MTRTYTPDEISWVGERSRNDFERLAFEGFGVKLDRQQLAARERIGAPGPRGPQEAKYTMLSGGTRSGKTVLGFLMHAEACLYKLGVDRADETYWDNYDYGTLAGGPSDELALRMWAIGDALQKGAHEAQWDDRRRVARDGAFLSLYRMGKQAVGGITYGVARFTNGAHVDFRTFQGGAFRLEGGQWWFITWDEWASQPDHEIHQIKVNVLTSRARDHDSKIVLMAWPKPETEHHLIAVERGIEKGTLTDHQSVYLSAEHAFFTNRKALAVERRTKTKAEWMRTVLGRPAGGAMTEFKAHMLDRMFRSELSEREPRQDGFAYITAGDLGLGRDPTVILTGRIPIVNGKPIVAAAPAGQPWSRLRIVHGIELPPDEQQTIDRIGFEFIMEALAYGSRVSAVDASGMGGLAAFRALRETMRPAPLAFVSKSNDRIHGNIRLAAITNGLDLLTWGRSDERSKELGEDGYEWGLVEASDRMITLRDQMASFDRDAKDSEGKHDDWVWALLIMLWYVKRYFLVRGAVSRPVEFDVRRLAGQRRSRVITPRAVAPAVAGGVRLIQPRR